MTREHTNIVTATNGPRPAGPPDQCFYCAEPIGAQHKPDCVLRSRTVMVRMTVEYPIAVPQHWEEHNILFHRNEGTWCADNALEELRKIAKVDGCICHRTKYTFLREATAEEDALVPDEVRDAAKGTTP